MNVSSKQLFINDQPLKYFLDIVKKVETAWVFWKDRKGYYLGCNDLALQTSLCSSIIGKTDNDLWDDKCCCKEYVKNDQGAVLNTKTAIFFEEPAFDKQIFVKNLSIKSPLRDAANNIIGIFCVVFPLGNSPLSQVALVINKLHLADMKANLFLPSDINYNYRCLSKRERECAYYLIRGMSSKEIGKILHISSKTVECHIVKIKYKLNCYKRSEVIGKILDLGLIL